MDPTAAQQQPNSSPTAAGSILTKVNQSGQEVNIEDATNINSKVSNLLLKKSNLESQLKSLSSRKAKLIAGISIAALTTVATAAAIAIIAALSISISVACAIALPILLGVSVIALSALIIRLKKTNLLYNFSTNLEKMSEKNNKNQFETDSTIDEKIEEPKNLYEDKIGKLSNKILLNVINEFGFLKEENDDNEKNLLFKPFLDEFCKSNYNFENEKENIKKAKQDTCISYRYMISNANEEKDNGLCIEIKINYDRNLDTHNEIPMMNSIDVSLSKNNEVITKITKNT